MLCISLRKVDIFKYGYTRQGIERIALWFIIDHRPFG